MKTLIFDFDGTLVDSMQIYVAGFNKIGSEFGLPKIDESNIKELKQNSIKTIMKRYKIGPLKLAKLLKTVNQEVKPGIVDAKFFPEIKEILKKLKKNYQLGILTSNHLENVEAFLKKQNFESIFDFLYCSENLFGKDKVLKALIKKYKFDQKEILYFGDEIRDIEACQKVGVKIASVAWGFNDAEFLIGKNPDFLIKKPEDIFSILDK